MSTAAFVMVLVSASLHVLWNAVVKRSADKVSFAFLTSVAGTLAAFPVFAVSRALHPGPLGPAVWGLAAASGLVEALYLVTLFSAYDHADLSVAYPLSRGVAPLAALVPGVMVLGECPPPLALLGVGLVVCGVGAVSASALRRGEGRGASPRGLALAVCTGCLIAGYHSIDRRAMILAEPPAVVEYFFLMHLCLLLFVSAWVLGRPAYRRRVLGEWAGNRRGVVLVGVLSVIAYMLIMAALRLGNATVVAAARNIGIVLSTAVGGVCLGEKVSRRRAGGVLLVVGGVTLLLLSGE